MTDSGAHVHGASEFPCVVVKMDKPIDVSKKAVSPEEGRSGHSDESAEKRTSRKKRQGQKRRLGEPTS